MFGSFCYALSQTSIQQGDSKTFKTKSENQISIEKGFFKGFAHSRNQSLTIPRIQSRNYFEKFETTASFYGLKHLTQNNNSRELNLKLGLYTPSAFCSLTPRYVRVSRSPKQSGAHSINKLFWYTLHISKAMSLILVPKMRSRKYFETTASFYGPKKLTHKNNSRNLNLKLSSHTLSTFCSATPKFADFLINVKRFVLISYNHINVKYIALFFYTVGFFLIYLCQTSILHKFGWSWLKRSFNW